MDAGAPQRQPLPRQSRPIERPTRAARDPRRNNMRCRRRTRSAPRGSIARAPAPPACKAGRAAGLLFATPSGSDRPAGRHVPSNAGAQALAPPCARPYGLFPRAKAPCTSPTPASCNFGAEADELHFRIQWRRCRFSSVRTKTGRLAFRKRRAPVLFPNFLGVGVTQSNGTIKNRPTGLRVRIGAEITLSLELDGFRRVALG